MSYILDALKKQQAEQASDGATLRIQSDHTSTVSRSVLVYILIAVVLVNVGLLGWIFKEDLRRVMLVGSASLPTTSSADEELNADGKTARETQPPVEDSNPGPLPTTKPVAETLRPTAAPKSTLDAITPIQSSTSVSSTPSSTPARQSATASTRTPIALAALPAGEQIIYREFNYSSHIYTDDPSLCAIVIDGQRLKAGDAFKGLKIHAITEAGVIFDETRRGVSRLIEVSIFELWDT